MKFRKNRNIRPSIHIHIDDGNIPWSEKTLGQKVMTVLVFVFAAFVIASMIYIGIRFFKSREEVSQMTSSAQNSVRYAKILLESKGF